MNSKFFLSSQSQLNPPDHILWLELKLFRDMDQHHRDFPIIFLLNAKENTVSDKWLKEVVSENKLLLRWNLTIGDQVRAVKRDGSLQNNSQTASSQRLTERWSQ